MSRLVPETHPAARAPEGPENSRKARASALDAQHLSGTDGAGDLDQSAVSDFVNHRRCRRCPRAARSSPRHGSSIRHRRGARRHHRTRPELRRARAHVSLLLRHRADGGCLERLAATTLTAPASRARPASEPSFSPTCWNRSIGRASASRSSRRSATSTTATSSGARTSWRSRSAHRAWRRWSDPAATYPAVRKSSTMSENSSGRSRCTLCAHPGTMQR